MRHPIDSSAEENLTRKETDRLQREKKNFFKIIQNQKNEIEILQNNLKKLQTQNKTKVC